MRLWSSMVLGGALVLACGGTDDPPISKKPDSSTGAGGASGSAGSGGSSGASGSGGASGDSGDSGTTGSSGTGGDSNDAAADGGSPNTDASEDSPMDGGDSSAGSGARDGASEGGGTDSGVGIGGPGKVVCGDTACELPNSQCCLGFPIAGCQPVFPPVCVTSVMINCDDAQDCENGRTCCATVVAGNITGANCANGCNNGVVLCNDSTRCAGNTTCKPFAGLDRYRSCQP